MNLKSEEEIKKFEEYFEKYEQTIVGHHLSHLSLINISKVLEKCEDSGRAFTAFLDIKLSFTHIYRNLTNVRTVWNDNFSKGKLEGGSFLDSEQHFNKKMDMHYELTSFVLRYRSIWDKIMGFILLIAADDKEYEKFMKARSRKKSFKKSAEISGIPKEFYEGIIEKLEIFDNKFRTAEAHGTGVLRKYVFEMTPITDNPQEELILYWNFLNETIDKIGNIIQEEANKTLERNSLPCGCATISQVQR